MNRIGIIGGGVVGAAHASVLRHYCDVKVYDLEPMRASHSFRDTVRQEILFLCLPTPMRKDGTVDPTAIHDALAAIRLESTALAVILKSTLPPVEMLKCDVIMAGGISSFIYSPEFLTERTAELDLMQSSHFIFGENSATAEAVQAVEALFQRRWHGIPRRWTSLETASLVKYMRNVFFATKVGLMNEFDSLLRSFQAERRDGLELFMLDQRIGRSHHEVPGHDGKRGFGGSCFLKDVNGYLSIAREKKRPAHIVEAAWKSNLEIRGLDTVTEELARMVGRASSETMTAAEVEKLG